MRYYKIDITNATTGKPMLPSSLGGIGITSLLPQGGANIAALNVELDIPVAMYATPSGAALARIWGLSLKDIGNAFDLNDALVSIYGGMSKGLPLANPAQSGLLVKGLIFQAYGNWMGLEQTVDLQITPAAGTVDEPKNISFQWLAGTPMSQAITSTLKTAFPDAQMTVNISPRLVTAHDETGYYFTLSEFAGLVKDLSKSVISDSSYVGIDIAYNGATLVVQDGTVPPKPKVISFVDLIGQPTWIEPFTISFKTVMRADIGLSDVVTLPKSLATSTQQAFLRARDQTTFSGNYQIRSVHHYGNFRQPDGESWNTTFEAFQIPKAA